ncbi:MAG: hypothetical protein VX579_06340 [Nitrospinota bacterium]|nr:hypothetical protein [Nitrospinota bacterium]
MQPTVFFRRDLLGKLGGIDPTLHYVMDWDLWCRFIREKAIWLKVDDLYSAARVHPKTKTSSGGLSRLLEHWRVARKYTGSWFPRSSLGLFFSWGLEDAPQPLSLLFKIAYNLKFFFLFKEIKPNIHNSQFCQREKHISFPWYGDKANSIKIELEFNNFENLPENITLKINDQSFNPKLNRGLKNQSITIDQEFKTNLFNLSILTDLPVQFRILKVTPSV